MTHSASWLSILPPLLAITCAVVTRQVVISLLAGIILGWVIINNGHVVLGLADTVTTLVNVFAVADQTRVILFTCLMGSLLFMISRAGGIEGFVLWMQQKHFAQTRRSAQLFATLIGLGVYIETTITCLVVGTVARPLFDRLKISREKLAYICDSTSAPVCILLPFNGWGATVLGLLTVQAGYGHLGDNSALSVFIAAIPLNFYAIITVILVFIVSSFDWHIGPMRAAEQRTQTTGKVMRVDSPAQLEEMAIHQPVKEGVVIKARMMLVPLLTMIIMVLAGIIMTGVQGTHAAGIDSPTSMDYLKYASGSTAVLWGVSLAVVVVTCLMLATRQFRVNELMDYFFKGAGGMLPMATLMLLAFGIGATCDALETGPWLAQWSAPYLSPILIAPLIFVTACLIAFSTGTSFGTFAIMIPLALPLAGSFNELQAGSVSIPLVLSAVLGGGVFGDHCSPISDTTVLSSMASCCDHIDHVRTQMPYAMLAATLTLALYIIIGLLH